MSVERTLALLKPGVLERRIVGEILGRLERKGFAIVALKLMRISRSLAETHYAEHREKPFYGPLCDYMTSGPVVAMTLERKDAVEVLRSLVGATDPDKALPGTIRGDYGVATRENIVHASDSASSARREIGLFFRAEEIVSGDAQGNGTR